MLVTLAGSPSQSKPVGFARFPLLSLTRHLPPARGKSFLKVGALGSPRKLHLFAKASPFGRGGCERSEQTERARTLPAARMFPQETSAANTVFRYGSTRENGLSERSQAFR